MKKNNKEHWPSCEQVKAYDIVEYLQSLGIRAVRQKGCDHWYLSPLRMERTASFKVNQRMNRWFDFGLGQGGNLVDFGITYFQCTVKEFLQRFGETNQTKYSESPERLLFKNTTFESVAISAKKPLYHPALISFLLSRRIPTELATKYCQEVNFEISGKAYFALGFANQSGGYELRSKYYKGSSTPKDFTYLNYGNRKIRAFEGFFDFMSFLVLFPTLDSDFLILNSLSFFERARVTLETYSAIELFFDNDASGQKCSRYAISLSDRYVDRSALYLSYKDLNDYLCAGKKIYSHDLVLPFKPP
ncbi:toprim domain-containing protein [Taibaiella chishuiensis]|uniref:CHC2-type zinc finger protein n=1 Tax=Taibaiella chishuiensis TaxID=1434707 RepID=A0A2P8D0X8_9BACT|nr:toprim domain-containing protein [Taibaiella chishuiensis]PSK90857.1 CHC2-type zinc finger protein [Taibaiella chishuiensis]